MYSPTSLPPASTTGRIQARRVASWPSTQRNGQQATAAATEVQRNAHGVPIKKTSVAKADTRRWLPTPSELGASILTGALGALLIAPFWMRRKMPEIRTTSLEKNVDEALESSGEGAKKGDKSYNEFITYISQPAGLLMMIPILEPRLIPPAIGVSLLLGLAYLGANVLSGMQEVWVRYQESLIRANLVANLDEAYDESIRAKTKVDEANHRYAEARIHRMLKEAGIQNPDAYLRPYWDDDALAASPQNEGAKLKAKAQTDASVHKRHSTNFPIYPQNRHPLPREANANAIDAASQSKKAEPNDDASLNAEGYLHPVRMPYQSPLSLINTSRPTLDVIGATMGFSATSILLYAGKQLYDFLDEKSRKISEATQQNREADSLEIIKTTLAPQNTEGVLLKFFSSRKGLALGGLFVTLGIMLHTLKFLVEGLREIEVTRLNAETEKQYETYKLTQLEPHFKAVSERSQLENALQRLEEDLPELKQHPRALHQRVQRILDDIGLVWSAPNYYAMSPIVQLVPARS